MNLNEQLQRLIDDAPEDGSMPILIEHAVVPVLRLLAQRLQHLEYYVLQSLDGGWVLTTLSHREQPGVEKQAIYAFATLEDARAGQNQPNPQLIAAPVPVASLLFQLFALQQASSILFMETPGDLRQGLEVKREELQHLVQLQWQEWNRARNLPPDIG
ncbi:MAG: hypothetical protein HC910_11065 [Spirulinaceae cyanobacterium SM2_1_0]|nr:hypothetical protein [Spirulinaceae cyanobacterium SM2_1_0]